MKNSGNMWNLDFFFLKILFREDGCVFISGR